VENTEGQNEAYQEDGVKAKSETKDGKPNIRYWRTVWTAAEKASKRWRDDVKDSVREYLAGRDYKAQDFRADEQTRFPLYWSICKTIQPAIYSRTPVGVAEKAFDTASDPTARLAAICVERLAKNLMERAPFDRVMYATRDAYIHGEKATCRIIFEGDITSETRRKNYQAVQVPGPDGQPVTQYIDEGGAPFQGQEILQDENGFFTEEQVETLKGVKCEPVPLHYCDYCHTPNARHWEEIDWIRFKTPMRKQECIKYFGEEIAKKLKYSSLSDEKKDKKENEVEVPTLYAFVGETWDKQTKQVYWDCEGYDEDFIKIEDKDPWELVNFFPCPPFMLGTCGPDDMYPVPAFIQIRPMIDQLHAVADRLRRLIRSYKTIGVFDDNVPELRALQNLDDEGIFLAVGKFRELIGDGGLDRLVKFFPIREIADSISNVVQSVTFFEQKVNELFGVPDILRGISDPRETAAAQQQKGKFISLAFSATQREFQRLCRDTIEMLVDLALKKFPDRILQDIMGYTFMKPEEQQIFPAALELLRNDQQRIIRINIETDSTITMNQNAEIENRNYLAKTLLDGIGAVAKASAENPALLPPIMETVLFVIRGIKDGKQIEETLKQSLQQAMQPKQDQGPDIEAQKLQLESQKLQQQQAMQQQDLEFKAQELQLRLAEQQSTQALEAQKLQLEAAKVQQDGQVEAMHANLQAQLAASQANMDRMKLELEHYKTIMTEREKLIEERRLARDELLQEKVASTKQQPMVINVEQNRPKKRRAKIVHLEDGSAVVETDEIPLEYAE
jgi:hypothetical protein